MININYSNEIKITTEQLNEIYSDSELPLKVEIRNAVSDDLVWSTELNEFMWASFPNSEMNNTRILDAEGNVIYQYTWDVMSNGSIFYKSLWLYCNKILKGGKIPNGLAIGTHDGEFGEWCPLVHSKLSNITLVEASSKQFEKLNANYGNHENVKLINSLITTDGKPVEFFEGGRGYTNSIVERVIRDWEVEKISSTLRESVSITNLVLEKCGKLDWLHLDVEGLDADLIMGLRDDLLPNFIIFEDGNLLENQKTLLMNFLEDRGYKSKSENGICMSIK